MAPELEQFDPIGEIYLALGKKDEPYFRLVNEFYAGVEKNEILRPLYPEDLQMPKEHLALFLIQRTGGPQTYSLNRGHPRMRARHMPFKIATKERDAWIDEMTVALNAVPEFASHKAALMEFFEGFATFLINSPD
ncbi:MAG TPA: globin [Planktothrix sp.]|jgi:hemoglobin